MILDKNSVILCGKLARMQMTEAETAIYEQQLRALFNWVDELSTVDTTGVDIADTGVSAHLRADEPVTDEALNQTLIGAFSAAEGRSAKVKKVL